MMYFNLIWMWGHPEVYILVLPSFGIFSEVVSTFSKKTISGYTSMVCAAVAITLLSYLVWLHHFFTMGAGANVNAFFGIVTLLIAIPSGVQVFNWIRTMYRGSVTFTTPMLWFMGFMSTFPLGGMAGLLLANPPVDFQVHNSLFLVAHFHTMIVGVALFGIFAGLTFWFPKIFGFTLDERLGRRAFWLWLIGFFVSFIPLYLLGFMGAPRRVTSYDSSTGWQPLFIVSTIGFVIIMWGVATQVQQLIISIKDRNQHRDTTGDPWDGRSLEWITSSPPPFYNFAVIPTVTSREPFWHMKRGGRKPSQQYQDIELPKNTPMGIYVSAFAFLMAFAIVWHILWLILVGLVGVIACITLLSFNEETEYVLNAGEIEKIENNFEIIINNMQHITHHNDDTKIFGFWVYLMTDLVIFAVLFATYLVLQQSTFGGLSARELFHLPSAFAETILLLTSSFTCSLPLLPSIENKNMPPCFGF